MPLATSTLQLLGVDFTCAPSKRKPITVAFGHRVGAVLRLERVLALATWPEFEALLAQPGPWLGAFDFPFGLPRVFVESQGLGENCAQVAHQVHTRCATRMDFRHWVDAWGNTRPAGQRLVHRACDTALPGGIQTTSPLQTRYVPVGFMYFEGVKRLLDAGVALPGLQEAPDEALQEARHEALQPLGAQRVALEAYPGLLAHELIGRRSYKNKSDVERLIARKDILARLEQGATRLQLRLKLTPAQHEALVDDASGDRLDAVLALMQAAWCAGQPRYGLPERMDRVEGWIATA